LGGIVNSKYSVYLCTGKIATKKLYHFLLFIKMSYLTVEKKANIFKEFGGSEKNTGSVEAQVALLTERITSISGHMKVNKKDFASNRGLMKMVGQRKRLLSYLSKTNLSGYRALIEKLGLRK
jgi:small subunit ribosomal protein S15